MRLGYLFIRLTAMYISNSFEHPFKIYCPLVYLIVGLFFLFSGNSSSIREISPLARMSHKYFLLFVFDFAYGVLYHVEVWYYYYNNINNYYLVHYFSLWHLGFELEDFLHASESISRSIVSNWCVTP